MIKLACYDNKGVKKEDLSVKIAERFLKLNMDLVSQAIRVEQNHVFNKTGQTKTRAEISGGGKKPWKQKGTGRARAGSNRSPLWRGGGITFGPTKESKVLTIPKKMREAAFMQMVAKLMQEKYICVIENIAIKSQKTKDAHDVLAKISPEKRALLVSSLAEAENMLAWKNLTLLESVDINHLALNDLLKERQFIITKPVFDSISIRLQK